MRASEDLQYMHQQTLLSNAIAAVPKLLTALCCAKKARSCPTGRKLPLVKEESLNGHKGGLHLYLSPFWFSDQSLEKFYGLSIVYNTSVKDLEKLENQFTLLNGRH